MRPSQGREAGPIPVSRSRSHTPSGVDDVGKSDFPITSMSYYVYMLFSEKDHKFYVGYSKNLRQRITQHNNGEVKSTKNRRPLKLIHYEYFINEKDAKMREIFLKSGFGRDQMKKALQHTLDYK